MIVDEYYWEDKGKDYHVSDEKHYEKWIENTLHVTFLLLISKYGQ